MDNEPDPIVLVDTKESKIVAYDDQTEVKESETVKYTYEYGERSEVGVSFHRGLGFCDKEEDDQTSPFIEKKDGSISDSSSSEEIDTDMSSPEKNSGFLSIGGIKLYTDDKSDEEDDDDDDDDKENDEECLESSESEDTSKSSDGDTSSDIDDEITKDYVEGIGGNYNDDKGNGDICAVDINDTIRRLGGIALLDASREYGMKKPQSRRKSQSQAKSIKFRGETDDWSVIDDLMFVKDPRILYAQKKKHAAKAEKSNRSRRFPGKLLIELSLHLYCWLAGSFTQILRDSEDRLNPGICVC